jgi:hypothetical protein
MMLLMLSINYTPREIQQTGMLGKETKLVQVQNMNLPFSALN